LSLAFSQTSPEHFPQDLPHPIIRSRNPCDPFIRAILFGIFWTGNCGTMPTTIASQQNVFGKVDDDSGIRVSFLILICFDVPASLILCFAG
jgi:phosphate transporter